MANKYLVVVDMQNDFVDGALGSAEAQKIVSRVVKKAKDFDGKVVYTQDTHFDNYLSTQEGKMLPVKHCIEGTSGWKLVPELEELQQKEGCKVYHKYTFGSIELAAELQKEYQKGEVSSVEIVGLCTDICVVSCALVLKAFMPELPLSLDASCCAGVTPEKHRAAIETLKSCQFSVIE